MDPMEALDRLKDKIETAIREMEEALGQGVCLTNPNPAQAYANCVGRIEAWNYTLSDIDEIRQQYIDE